MNEKQSGKKWRLVKSIFKWLFIVLLALLLLVGLIFRAPWKVLALLAIFLMACTVLPKPTRKWFWLAVGLVIIALIIWIFLPDNNEGWRPYTFDEERARLQAKYAIPDEDNAAFIYDELLENYDANSYDIIFDDKKTFDLTRRRFWSSRDYPKITQWLKSHQYTIDTLFQASKINKCRFPITSFPKEWDKFPKRCSSMRHWVYLLVLAANNDMAEGRIDAGLEKYLCIISLAKHLCQQSSVIYVLTGIAIEGVATSQMNRFVATRDATEENLAIVEEALLIIKHNWCFDLPMILEMGAMETKTYLVILYEINPKGKVRLSHNPTALWRVEYEEAKIEKSYRQKRLAKVYVIFEWFFFPTSPQKTAQIIDAGYRKLYKMADPNYIWPASPPTIIFPSRFDFMQMNLLKMAIPSEAIYHNLHNIYLQTTLVKHGSRILIALRRYKNKSGVWPEKLDDIKFLGPAEIFVDPFNADGFIYKPTRDSFVLYSKGRNTRDDGGAYHVEFDPNEPKWQEPEKDDILIWPPRSQKAENKPNKKSLLEQNDIE